MAKVDRNLDIADIRPIRPEDTSIPEALRDVVPDRSKLEKVTRIVQPWEQNELTPVYGWKNKPKKAKTEQE